MSEKKEPKRWVTVAGKHFPIYEDENGNEVFGIGEDTKSTTLEDKYKNINPGYKPNGDIYDKTGRNNNCVECAVAFEANMRGEDVEANAFEFGNPTSLAKSRSIHTAFGISRGDVWDVDRGSTAKTIKEIELTMEDFGDGSRAIIQCESKGFRHTMNVMNDGGNVVFVDAQRGIHGDGKKVLKDINTQGMGLIRTDDKPINEEYAKWAYKRRQR